MPSIQDEVQSYIQEAKCRLRKIKYKWREELTAATAVILNRNVLQFKIEENSESNHLHMISWH